MATFVIAFVAVCGWGVAIWQHSLVSQAQKRCDFVHDSYLDAARICSMERRRADKLEIQCNAILDKIRAKAAEMPMVGNAPVKLGWAGIRKASEQAIRREDSLAEKRERDTAFVE